MHGAAPLPLPCPSLQTIDDFHSDVASASAGMQGAIADVQHNVVVRMQELQQQWQPRLDKLDVV